MISTEIGYTTVDRITVRGRTCRRNCSASSTLSR